MFLFFFFLPFHSAAAQHLRMQNEQASETVAMVIVTRLTVTRILIEAHTATRLLGRPSRWKQQQLMASLLSRVSGCTLFLTSWRCLTYSRKLLHILILSAMRRCSPPVCVEVDHLLGTKQTDIKHRRCKSTPLLDAGSVTLYRSTLQTAWGVLQRWHEGNRVEGRR